MDQNLFTDAPAPDASLFTNEPAPKAISMPESFGRGAANNFPLAPQAIAALSPSGDYSSNLADWNQKAQMAKKANPVSYGAGAVTGAVAPLAIPGVGEALEASPIAGNALLGAANAISNTDVTKAPEQALKQAAIGAGVGGAVGGIGNAILPGAGAANKLENMASDKAVQTLNLRPGMLAHLEPEEVTDLGKFAREADLVQGDTTSRLAKVQDLKQQVGAQIGEMGAGNIPSGDLTEFTTPLQEAAEKSAKFFGAQGNSDLNTYRQGIANLQNNGKTFEELQALKSAYGEKAFDANHQVRDKAAADVYGQIKDAMAKMISSSPSEYQEAMTNYKNLSDIENGLIKQLGTERSGGTSGGGMGIASIVRRLPGQKNPAINLPTAAALGSLGHPLMGVMAAMPTLTNPAIGTKVLGGAAKAVPKLSQMTEQELNDYLTSKLGGTNAQ